MDFLIHRFLYFQEITITLSIRDVCDACDCDTYQVCPSHVPNFQLIVTTHEYLLTIKECKVLEANEKSHFVIIYRSSSFPIYSTTGGLHLQILKTSLHCLSSFVAISLVLAFPVTISRFMLLYGSVHFSCPCH